MHINRLATASAIGWLLLIASGCSRDDDAATALESGEGLLQYIPADAPYVAAAAAPLPPDVRQALLDRFRPVIAAYGDMLRFAIAESGGGQAASQSPPASPELVAELIRLLTPEGLESAGIGPESTAALYGHGSWPVLRVSLSDGTRMEATLSRLEEKLGAKMSTAVVEGERYRIAREDPIAIIVAIVDGYLVASLVPAEPPAGLVKTVLGLELPARHIAEAGMLTELAAEYGYTPYGLGFLDTGRLLELFLEGQPGLSGAFMAGTDPGYADVSERCREEARSLAAVVPRLVTGYTEVTAERVASNSVIEVRQDIAAGLAAIPAPVPGLGQNGRGGLLRFGMSFDPGAARAFYAERLDALAADPYECEWFAGLADSVAQGRAALDQPLPPVVYSFRGFLAVVDALGGMNLGAGQPPTDVDMQLLVATDNAEALVALGALFSPEIASLNLKPDARPVRLPVPPAAAQIGPLLDSAWVAMSDRALALSLGAGGETRLPEMLASPPAEPSPFMSLEMDAGAYYGFIADATVHGGTADGEERSEAFHAAFGRTMQSLEEAIARIAVEVYFSERGIEFPATVEFSD